VLLFGIAVTALVGIVFVESCPLCNCRVLRFLQQSGVRQVDAPSHAIELSR
jgi:hypothetical protein